MMGVSRFALVLLLVLVPGMLRADARPGAGLPGPVRLGADRDLAIAIIGGGTSGLTAAYELAQRGYRRITVYEAEERVGGKVHSVTVDGHVLELGAVLAAKGSPTIYRMARELGILALAPFSPKVLVADRRADGTVVRVPLEKFWGGFPTLAVVRGLLRFAQVAWLSRFRDVFRPGYYDVHPDLVNLSMTQFAEKHGFRAILEPVHVVLFACGYGAPDDIAAIYWIKMMKSLMKIEIRQNLTFHLSPGYWTYVGGFQALWEKVAAYLARRGVTFRLGTRVTRVERCATGAPRITVSAGGRSDVFDRLLVTTSPQDTLRFLDASPEEQELFGKVKTFAYDAVVFRARGLGEREWVTLRHNMAHARIGHLFSYYNDRGTGIFTGYQYAGPIDRGELDRLLAQDVAELGGTLESVVVRRSWTYFPHIPRATLTVDDHPKLNALQGVRGTYYLGGLFAFESTDHCAEFAEFLVDRY